jgi:hypothetical protein
MSAHIEPPASSNAFCQPRQKALEEAGSCGRGDCMHPPQYTYTPFPLKKKSLRIEEKSDAHDKTETRRILV